MEKDVFVSYARDAQGADMAPRTQAPAWDAPPTEETGEEPILLLKNSDIVAWLLEQIEAPRKRAPRRGRRLLKTWIDVQDLQPGDAWFAKVREKLKKSRRIVALITLDYFERAAAARKQADEAVATSLEDEKISVEAGDEEVVRNRDEAADLIADRNKARRESTVMQLLINRVSENERPREFTRLEAYSGVVEGKLAPFVIRVPSVILDNGVPRTEWRSLSDEMPEPFQSVHHVELTIPEDAAVTARREAFLKHYRDKRESLTSAQKAGVGQSLSAEEIEKRARDAAKKPAQEAGAKARKKAEREARAVLDAFKDAIFAQIDAESEAERRRAMAVRRRRWRRGAARLAVVSMGLALITVTGVAIYLAANLSGRLTSMLQTMATKDDAWREEARQSLEAKNTTLDEAQNAVESALDGLGHVVGVGAVPDARAWFTVYQAKTFPEGKYRFGKDPVTKKEFVIAVQECLNKAIDSQLKVDGIWGRHTQDATCGAMAICLDGERAEDRRKFFHKLTQCAITSGKSNRDDDSWGEYLKQCGDRSGYTYTGGNDNWTPVCRELTIYKPVE